MKPEDRYPTSRFPSPRVPQRDSSSYSPPKTPQTSNQSQAAANIVRDKLENIYEKVAEDHHKGTEEANQQPATQSSQPAAVIPKQQDLKIDNPYQRTHTSSPQPQAEQWKQYHTAWQNYYQKYYERYYVGKVQEATSKIDTGATEDSRRDTSQPDNRTEAERQQDDAIYELRRKLREKVSKSAKKVRSSHHFVPIAAALVVVVVFVFLQYNRVLISNVKAYVSPGSIDPQNIVIDPTASIEVGPEPELIIPKINVDVPVVYGVGPDNTSQMRAMERGVAHFSIPGANSTPGQIGNTVISGHSSNDLFDAGDYKFIFAQLDKLTTGDMIYANYEGTRYSYTVTKKEVVMPTEVDKLIYPTDKPVLTLITCTPLGTAEKRLLVTAEQVSPDPTKARPSSGEESGSGANFMPSNSPTLTQRIFGR